MVGSQSSNKPSDWKGDHEKITELAKKNKAKPAAQEDPKNTPNVSHTIISGNMIPDLTTTVHVQKDPDEPVSKSNLKEVKDTGGAYGGEDVGYPAMFAGSKSYTQAMHNFSSRFGNDAGWTNQAGMSLEGLLLPCAVEFIQRKPEGTNAEYISAGGERPTINEGTFSAFEQPNSKLMDWWHVGSGTVTSTTLNPFPYGHHVSTVLRGGTQENLQIHKLNSGYGKGAAALG